MKTRHPLLRTLLAALCLALVAGGIFWLNFSAPLRTVPSVSKSQGGAKAPAQKLPTAASARAITRPGSSMPTAAGAIPPQVSVPACAVPAASANAVSKPGQAAHVPDPADGPSLGPIPSPKAEAGGPPSHALNQVLVRFRAGISDAEINAMLQAALPGSSIRKSLPLVPGLKSVSVPPGTDIPSFVALMAKSPLVAYAEPDHISYINRLPNDPFINENKQGNMYATLPGTVDINCKQGWDVRTDTGDTIVAVIDTGTRYTHQDLADNMWKNPGETGLDGGGNDKASNGIDDDGDGYIDDVFGINAITGTGNPSDDNGHGTHCSGNVGGVGDNGIGMTGVAWKTHIMSLKCFTAAGSAVTSDEIECFQYALAKGAHIISCSWGGDRDLSQSMLDTLRATRDAGQIVVIGSGNDGFDVAGAYDYPAAYNVGNLVVVGSNELEGTISDFSNYGTGYVSL
ncbi:MAG: S8 family serine peptidase, partial [Verrucomicrobiota bacterium]